MLIKLRNIFCSGRFQISLAKSPLGSEISISASWWAWDLNMRHFNIFLVESARLDRSLVSSFAVPFHFYLVLCTMLMVALTILIPFFKFRKELATVVLSPYSLYTIEVASKCCHRSLSLRNENRSFLSTVQA